MSDVRCVTASERKKTFDALLALRPEPEGSVYLQCRGLLTNAVAQGPGNGCYFVYLPTIDYRGYVNAVFTNLGELVAAFCTHNGLVRSILHQIDHELLTTLAWLRAFPLEKESK